MQGGFDFGAWGGSGENRADEVGLAHVAEGDGVGRVFFAELRDVCGDAGEGDTAAVLAADFALDVEEKIELRLEGLPAAFGARAMGAEEDVEVEGGGEGERADGGGEVFIAAKDADLFVEKEIGAEEDSEGGDVDDLLVDAVSGCGVDVADVGAELDFAGEMGDGAGDKGAPVHLLVEG